MPVRSLGFPEKLVKTGASFFPNFFLINTRIDKESLRVCIKSRK